MHLLKSDLLNCHLVKEVNNGQLRLDQLDVEFLLKLIKKLSISRNIFVHEFDEMGHVRVEGHRHVVGEVVGHADGLVQKATF